MRASVGKRDESGENSSTRNRARVDAQRVLTQSTRTVPRRVRGQGSVGRSATAKLRERHMLDRASAGSLLKNAMRSSFIWHDKAENHTQIGKVPSSWTAKSLQRSRPELGLSRPNSLDQCSALYYLHALGSSIFSHQQLSQVV
eukprot:6190281-Pleurochrysis_carterae.AAC.2